MIEEVSLDSVVSDFIVPQRDKPKVFDGDIPWCRIEDFNGVYLSRSKSGLAVSKELVKSMPLRLYPKGTVLVSCSAYLGKCAIVSQPLVTNQTFIGLVPSKKLDSLYLYYLMRSKANQLNDMAAGATIKYLSKKKFQQLKVFIPSLEIQKRIASILDNAAALRDKTAQLLKEYDLLAQSIFLDMFGDPVINPNDWEIEKLNDICDVGSSRRVFVDELVGSGIPFYRGKEIGALSTGELVNSGLFITKKHYNSLAEATGVPKIGDLLMPSICSDGRIFRVQNTQPFYFKDGRVLWIKVNQSKINSFYLKFFLKELFRTNYSNIASGTTFAELKIVALKKIKTLTPPIELQNQFADKIALIEQQKVLAKKELQESEDLFNCLLQKAFKGELVNN